MYHGILFDRRLGTHGITYHGMRRLRHDRNQICIHYIRSVSSLNNSGAPGGHHILAVLEIGDSRDRHGGRAYFLEGGKRRGWGEVPIPHHAEFFC